MKKIYLLSALLLLLGSLNISAQQLISDSLLVHFTKGQVDSAYTANGNNDQTGIYHQAMVATAGKVFPYAKYDNKSGIFITCLQDSVWPTLTPSFLQYQNVIVFVFDCRQFFAEMELALVLVTQF